MINATYPKLSYKEKRVACWEKHHRMLPISRHKNQILDVYGNSEEPLSGGEKNATGLF